MTSENIIDTLYSLLFIYAYKVVFQILTGLLKALGDQTRLRILNLLREESLCVCELEYILGISQSNASRHLDKLRNAGLVDCTQKAQWRHFYIRSEFVEKYPFFRDLLQRELVQEFPTDLDKLQEYKNSSLSCEDLRPLMAEKGVN